MSRDVAALVLSRRFGSVTRKAVALVIADHASITDQGEISTIVGQKRIACEAEVSERSVRAVLAEFEAEGIISRKARMRQEGRGRTSDRISIHRQALEHLPEAVSAKSYDQPATDADQPATGARPTGKAIAGHRTVSEPSDREPSVIAAAPLNELKKVLVEVFGEPPPQNWSLYNRIATWIRDRGGTPDLIRFKASRIVEEWGIKALTVTSLEKHWTRYDAEVGQLTEDNVEQYQAATRRLQRQRRAETLEAQARGLPG